MDEAFKTTMNGWPHGLVAKRERSYMAELQPQWLSKHARHIYVHIPNPNKVEKWRRDCSVITPFGGAFSLSLASAHILWQTGKHQLWNLDGYIPAPQCTCIYV